MPRAAKSKVHVEIETAPHTWKLFKAGFKRIPEAEEWIRQNIMDGSKLRAVKVSGVFLKQTSVVKR